MDLNFGDVEFWSHGPSKSDVNQIYIDVCLFATHIIMQSPYDISAKCLTNFEISVFFLGGGAGVGVGGR